MASHTLTDAAKMTGRSRRTIQRYIKSGKLSYKNNNLGNPQVETSELIRVFGEVSHPVTPNLSQNVTSDRDQLLELLNEVTKPLLDEIIELKNEVQSLKRITHKKDSIEYPEITTSPRSNSKKATKHLDDIPDLGDYFNSKNDR